MDTARTFAETDEFQNARELFVREIQDAFPSIEFEKINNYLRGVIGAYDQDNSLMRVDRKDKTHQHSARMIMDQLIRSGAISEAMKFFNLHRGFTRFSGYGPNEKASSDVKTFLDAFEIPETGELWLMYFFARNGMAFMDQLIKQGGNAEQVRMVIPRIQLLAHMMEMEGKKLEEFTKLCDMLRPEQVIAPNVDHVSQIAFPDMFAGVMAPRALAISPLQKSSEERTRESVVNYVREMAGSLVPGGRIMMNIAVEKGRSYQGVRTEKNENSLAKISGLSEGIVQLIVQEMSRSGLQILDSKSYEPKDINPQTDHSKLAKGVIVQKPL